MKYRDKTLPTREAFFWDVELVGYEKARLTMCYDTVGKDTETFVRQPMVISFCTMRQLSCDFHRLLNELEDQLQAAREEMKGDR